MGICPVDLGRDASRGFKVPGGRTHRRGVVEHCGRSRAECTRRSRVLGVRKPRLEKEVKLRVLLRWASVYIHVRDNGQGGPRDVVEYKNNSGAECERDDS